MKALRLLFAVLVAGVFTGMCIGLLAQTPIKVDAYPAAKWWKSDYWEDATQQAKKEHKPILISFMVYLPTDKVYLSLMKTLDNTEVQRQIVPKYVLYQIHLDNNASKDILVGGRDSISCSVFTIAQRPTLVLYWPDTQKAVEFTFPMSPSEFLRELKLTE